MTQTEIRASAVVSISEEVLGQLNDLLVIPWICREILIKREVSSCFSVQFCDH